MKKIVIFLLMISIFILLSAQGCQKPKQTVSGEQPPITIIKAPEKAEQPSKTIGETRKTPEKCDYMYEAQDIKKIDLSMIKGGILEKTNESFSFRVVPQTANGSIVAADGFTTVKIYSTKFDGGVRATDYEVYRSSYRLNDENVAGDCSSEKITVKFADIQKADNYKFVKEGDPAIMFVEFSVTGSRSIFEAKYEPEKYGESLLR